MLQKADPCNILFLHFHHSTLPTISSTCNSVLLHNRKLTQSDRQCPSTYVLHTRRPCTTIKQITWLDRLTCTHCLKFTRIHLCLLPTSTLRNLFVVFITRPTFIRRLRPLSAITTVSGLPSWLNSTTHPTFQCPRSVPSGIVPSRSAVVGIIAL
jgi:hypothetical protein